jgi:hypothetical protein
MYLDDIRNPFDKGFMICRSSQDAISCVEKHGMPIFISFDHDLGGDDTSMKFIHWLSNQLADGNLKFPKEFMYYIHSANPVGKENIRGLMTNLRKHFPSE